MNQIQLIAPKNLQPSKTNPRKHFGSLDDLAASIRAVDVIEPLLVRPLKGKSDMEIVCGERRWRASKLAEKDAIPCIVRDMTDDQALEVQIVENSQREDVHPLDEADGYKALIDRKYSAQQIADKVGRSLAHVAQRLKLCTLSAAVREALNKETITAGVAMVLARVPNHKLQDGALTELTRYRDSTPSVADAKKFIEEDVLLMLKNAQFDIKDATLVPAAGACTACNKRTGNQRELFDDVTSPDLCTDPPCFRSKQDALFQLRVKNAKAEGVEVLEGAKAKAAGTWNSPYVKLDNEEYIGGKEITVRKMLEKANGKDGMPQIVIARDERTGETLEMVKRSDSDAAKRKIAKIKEPVAGARQGDPEKAFRERQKREAEITRRLDDAIRSKAPDAFSEEVTGPMPLLRAMALGVADVVWNETVKKVADAMGIPKAKGASDWEVTRRIRPWAKTAKAEQLMTFMLSALCKKGGDSTGSAFSEALAALKIDRKAITKKIAEEAAAKKKLKKAKPAAAAAPAKTTKRKA